MSVNKKSIKNDAIDQKNNNIVKDGVVIAKIDGSWCYFPLSSEKEFYYKFLLSETQKEQRENFYNLAAEVLKKAKQFIR